MSIFSAIGKLFKKIWAAIMKMLKWLLPIIIIILVIIAIFFPYLLPVIWGWVATAWTAVSTAATAAWGAVSSWVATGWQWLTTAASAIWNAGGEVASTAWSAASEWVAEASLSDVLKLATGAAVILNPEGVGSAIGNIVEGAAEAVGKVLKAVGPLGWAAIAAGVYFFFIRDDEKETRLSITQVPGGPPR